MKRDLVLDLLRLHRRPPAAALAAKPCGQRKENIPAAPARTAGVKTG